ncbi:putative Peptidase M43 pregnancy-associated plasma-A domain-containing protein [Seiridium cardinale]|uniref:Peptidase M43 pregnancy-associated plasma-A domain-containing protein n=1 Tax=Seiridium cardinale TaxID=138064 RepID=A0ABR2XB89_9PEZI
MKAFTLAVAFATFNRAVSTRARCLVDGSASYSTHRRQVTDFPSSIAVDVHFHIVSTADDAGFVTDDIIASQWDVLYENYAKHNITLTLNSTERIVDELAGQGWLVYNGTSWVSYPEEKKAFFKSTRKGGYDELNLYFISPWSPGLSGYCTFPTTVSGENDDAFGVDACQISALSMPGIPAERATLDGYTLGHVAVHESGHWFGLSHVCAFLSSETVMGVEAVSKPSPSKKILTPVSTPLRSKVPTKSDLTQTFAGGCDEPGDYVADTPASGLVYDCPAGSDTCPGVAGLDPIHNFMSYTNDTCTNEFTPGQRDRIYEIFYSYRRSLE